MKSIFLNAMILSCVFFSKGAMAQTLSQKELEDISATLEAFGGLPEVMPPLPPLTPSPEISAMLESVSALQMENTMRIFSGFYTRHHNHPEATKAQEWLKANWEWIVQNSSDVQERYGSDRGARLIEFLDFVAFDVFQNEQPPTYVRIENRVCPVQVDFFHHPEELTRMPSVILTIEGSDPDIIVLGAHADSAVKHQTGVPVTDETMDLRSPGADDNASGIAVLTEVLRVLMDHGHCPSKTVMLMAYAAEELGLKGSEDIANTFAREGKNVVGMINFDLTNYRGSPDINMAIVNDPEYTSLELNRSLIRLIETYLPEIHWDYTQCRRGCSDHASWANAGFPATMLVEARAQDITPHIHKTTDTFEASGGNANHSVTFAQLALAYIAETN